MFLLINKEKKAVKQTTFIVTFVATNVLFIFLQIHKNGLFIKESFRQQKLAAHRSELEREKAQLTHQLCALKSHQKIKEFAHTELGMNPVKLTQIKQPVAP